MSKIWLTSDPHFCHNKEFLYKPRGFDNVWDMNSAIIDNWNKIVDYDDEIYLLGDIMLHDDELGLACLRVLKGKIHIILGNHDTDNRIEKFKQCRNVIEIAAASRLRYNKFHFFLTHYPCFTANLEKEHLSQMTCNLYGHTHQKTNFFNDIPFMYHVGLDSHDCKPILLDDIIEEMKQKFREVKYERSEEN